LLSGVIAASFAVVFAIRPVPTSLPFAIMFAIAFTPAPHFFSIALTKSRISMPPLFFR
jgi:hypothetical protein